MNNENPFARNVHTTETEKAIPQKSTEGTNYDDLLEKYTIHETTSEHVAENHDFDGMEKHLDALNYALENSSSEERDEKMQELLKWEEKLKTIENGCGVTQEVADTALTMVYNGSLDLSATLEELQTEAPEIAEAIAEGDNEKAKGFLMSLASKMQGSKRAQTVGLWTLLSIGGIAALGYASDAEGANLQTKTVYSKENIIKLHPGSSNVNMGSLIIQVNSNPNVDSTTKLIFTNVLKKNGLNANAKLVDYVSSGNLTDKEIETVIQLAESI